ETHELSFGGEDLHAMIAGVGHVQVAVRPEGHGADPGKLARLRSRRAPAHQELSVRVELADPLILAELRNVVVAVVVLQGIADVTELTRFGACLAAESAQQLTIGRIDANAVVV